MCGGEKARDVFATERMRMAFSPMGTLGAASVSPLDSLLGLHNEAR